MNIMGWLRKSGVVNDPDHPTVGWRAATQRQRAGLIMAVLIGLAVAILIWLALH